VFRKEMIKMPDNVDKNDADDAHFADDAKGEVVGFDRVFLMAARDLAQRASKPHADAVLVAGATAGAILLAAAACEARLSEFLAKKELRGEYTEEFLECVRERTRDPAERWKLVMRKVSSGEGTTADFEKQRFESLKCLFKLRNHVAHRSARPTIPGDWPDRLASCAVSVIPTASGPGISWTSALLVPDVAEWSVGTAGKWLDQADRLGIKTSC
jgi:hypothetical protein